MKRYLVLALMLATVGCVDVPLMESVIDNLVPAQEQRYVMETLLDREGDFAPEDDQSTSVEDYFELLRQAAQDPNTVPDLIQDVSWKEYTWEFGLPMGSRALVLELEVDWELLGGEDLNDGPAGTLNLSIVSPEGEELSDTPFEIIYWGESETEVKRAIPLPPLDGSWTITISGSGFTDLAGSIFYTGVYHIKVLGEVPEN